MKKPKPLPTVLCGECGAAAECKSASEIYPRRPDLWRKWVWVCICGARVGCHEETKNPLGTPAHRSTQDLRHKVHVRFDPLWLRKAERDGISKKAARRDGYLWLGDQLGLTPKECHIGMFNRERCLKALEILNALYRSSP